MRHAGLLRILSLTAAVLVVAVTARRLAAAPVTLWPDLTPWREKDRYLDNAYIVTANGGRKLWFTGTIANIGAGPFHTYTGTDGKIWQKVFRSDGTSLDRGMDIAFLPSNYGLIFSGAAIFLLRQVTAAGGVGPVAALSPKQNWALHDDYPYKVSGPYTPTDSYYIRGTTTPGISAGWADVYATSHPLQYIPLDNVADGVYWLEMVVDPNNRIMESDEANNTTRARIRIEGERVTVLPDDSSSLAESTLVYPNPWHGDEHAGQPMAFEGFGSGSIDIYTVTARPVRSVSLSGGRASWDLKDNDGRAVASGVYLFVGTDAQGTRAHGKLLVVR